MLLEFYSITDLEDYGHGSPVENWQMKFLDMCRVVVDKAAIVNHDKCE